MTKTPNIMLDIETLGTTPGSALRSIGAVSFALTGEINAQFYVNIDRQSCLDAGLTVDPATEKWWSEQSKEARDAFLVDPQPLKHALREFDKWFRYQGASIVWAQGANFDPVLLEAAYARFDAKVPWRFYNVRDTRTVYDVFNFDTRDLQRKRIHHNALDDTIHQVALVAAAVRKGRASAQEPVSAAGVFE
jgi:hypothetical protein